MRQVKITEKHHKFRGVESGNDLVLVGGKERSYLWVGPTKGAGTIYTFDGPAALRALAKAILKEVGP